MAGRDGRAVWYRLRCEVRSRGRAWLGLVVLVGLFGGVVLTAAAGARRTATAYERFLDAARASDVALTGDAGLLERLGGPPEAEATGSVARFFANPVDRTGRMDLGGGQPVAPVDGRFGSVVQRANVVEGRLPRPDRAGEALASREFARRNRLEVGDQVTLRFFLAGDDVEGVDWNRVEPDRGTPYTFRVVGIAVYPTDVVATHESEFATGLVLTPAFHEEHADSAVAVTHHLTLMPGTDEVAFLERLGALVDEDPEGGFALEAQAPLHRSVERAIRPQAQALGVFAVLLALAGLAVVGQAITRQLVLDATDTPALRAIGMAPRQLFTAGVARVAAVAVAGGGIAVAVAVAASASMPIGPARLAEPDPGPSADVAMLAGGLVAIVVLLVARGAFPAWRTATAARGRAGGAAPAGVKPSALAAAVARSGLPVTAATGVRMALEPGSGRMAVPVRSTLAAISVAIAAVAAALTFGSNLERFIDDPGRWGRPWDVTFDGHAGPIAHQAGIDRLRALPAVTAFAAGNVGAVTVDGHDVTALGFRAVDGDVFPTLLEGRRPASEDEIVLGAKELRRLGREVGDTVTVQVIDRAVEMRVVGRAVFPSIGGFLQEPTGLGTGAAVVPEVLASFSGDPEEPYTFFALRTRTGELTRELEAAILATDGPCPFPCYFRPARPASIANFSRVRATPVALAALLLVLACGTLAHTLVSTVRHRRRDLAILKTLGFVKRQVAAATAWQATTMVALSLLVALPIGVAAGRFGWALLADQLGVGTAAVTPVPALVLAVPLSIVVANAVAAVPARAAAATRPAQILRSE